MLGLPWTGFRLRPGSCKPLVQPQIVGVKIVVVDVGAPRRYTVKLWMGATMKQETMKISGMTCGGCEKSVANALRGVPGVSRVDVSASRGQAVVEFDDGAVAVEDLRAAVRGAGYQVGDAASEKRRGCCCG